MKIVVEVFEWASNWCGCYFVLFTDQVLQFFAGGYDDIANFFRVD